jgi:hypothetical protein
MSPDRRRVALALPVAELVLMAVFIVYAEAHSWNSSGGNWILSGYLLMAMLFNEAVDRLLVRASRRRGSHR